MIQRIQTVYLLIALLLSSLFTFLPFAKIHTEILYFFDSFGITHIENLKRITDLDTYPILILDALILIFTILSIFLFKNRRLQIRFVSITLLFQFGLYALIGYYAYFIATKTFDAGISWELSIAIPIINAILLYLAIRSILKDVALIKSLDRIR